jgi:hypothetical protein
MFATRSAIYYLISDRRKSSQANVELNKTALGNVDLSGANLVGIKYDSTTLPMIASSKLDNVKMSADMQNDLDSLKAGKA